MAIAVVAFL
jgi:hypothetical protein